MVAGANLNGSWDGIVLGPLPLLGTPSPTFLSTRFQAANLSASEDLSVQAQRSVLLGVVAGEGSVVYGLQLFQISGLFGVLLVSMDLQSAQYKVKPFPMCTHHLSIGRVRFCHALCCGPGFFPLVVTDGLTKIMFRKNLPGGP